MARHHEAHGYSRSMGFFKTVFQDIIDKCEPITTEQAYMQKKRNIYIDFQTLIHSHSFDLLGAESWLTNKIFDNKILLYGYTLIGKDRGS